MVWQLVTIAVATGIVVYTINHARRAIMADNAAILVDIQTRLTAVSQRFSKGLGEVTKQISDLQAANSGLNFAPILETLSGLETAAEALDELTPDAIEPDDDVDDGTTETPAPPADETPAPAEPGESVDESAEPTLDETNPEESDDTDARA